MGLTALHTWKYPIAAGLRRAPCEAAGSATAAPYAYDAADAGRKYAEDVADLIRSSTPGKVAAFIAEPIQGVGGAVEMPPGYLKQVYEHVRAAGGLCISDEVQTGFGRTGDNFWGFENHGVTPDIVTMAKGIGNGARWRRW
jgi:alanine-glyoxylate transaminase / (R)-3-amino-2-methylpropionate-pyruvate transaminase